MAEPEINVYASLPLKVERGVDLDLRPSNWSWVHCLHFSVEVLNTLQFSRRPYKWVRYAIGVVIGAQGHLYTGPDRTNVVDYNVALPLAPPVDSINLYYCIDDEERQMMFPIDPGFIRTQLTSTVTSTRRGPFRNEVATRDGERCVWTNEILRYCDAVHLVAHAKGNDVCYSFILSLSPLTIAIVVVHLNFNS
jgi:hypothetical protein